MARTYLVVIDDSPEARVALRFAARRAAKTEGEVDVLGVVVARDYVPRGAVDAGMAHEQRGGSGKPGPLVAHFTGNDAGKLPVPVMMIPGSLTDDQLERLS